MAEEYRLAVAIKNASGEFLVARQSPPACPSPEYESYVDSDLWDLPHAPLKPLADGLRSEVSIHGAESCTGVLDVGRFDLESAIGEVQMQVGPVVTLGGDLVFCKFAEEAEFGPGPSVHTLFVLRILDSEPGIFEASFKWISISTASKLLCEAKPGDPRIGPFFSLGLLHDLVNFRNWKPPSTLHHQEYPPGVTLVPMISRTLKPFGRTNLVVIVSDRTAHGLEEPSYIVSGNALVIDPGCCSQFHEELETLIGTLPQKLLVFVTHHHDDHVDGLSVIHKCNPDAILLAHENTTRRIGKEKWAKHCIFVAGGETICIGDQKLVVVSAQGHTDGHLALLHVNTNAVIAGDHCVGQGSAFLDARSGGNMKDYFQTTYKFLELSPHLLIPMHGRMNMWPKRMLCGYLKHRMDRESSILKAIEDGANTCFDILAKSYADTNPSLWLAASSNMRLHIDHLACQGKLPEGFDSRKFRGSCGFNFIIKWAWVFLWSRMSASSGLVAAAAAVVSFAAPFIWKWLLG